MATNKSSFQFLFGTLVILVGMMFASESAFSAMPPMKNIKCDTAFGESSFTIAKDKVAFYGEHQLERSRKISSVQGIKKVRTHKTLKGFTKVLYKDGNKHKIHIENAGSFDESNDYMTVVSPKGHKMTYPLSCAKI